MLCALVYTAREWKPIDVCMTCSVYDVEDVEDDEGVAVF
jgi:hypothetical protein